MQASTVPGRLLAVVLAIAAVGSFTLAWRAPAPGPPAVGVPRPVPVVPAWSVRRLPRPLSDAIGTMRLPIQVERAITGTQACFVLDAAGREVYTRNASMPLVPASTLKLLTAAAALSILGPDTRLETKVVAAGPPVNGHVERLYLVGGGDPLLMEAEYKAFLDKDPLTAGHLATPFERLVDQVVAAGVRFVDGGVVGDDTRYDAQRAVPSWEAAYLTDHDVTPVSALTLNGGFSSWERPAQVPGDPTTYAASELGRLLGGRLVAVAGVASRASAPPKAKVLATVASPPVREIVATMLRESDNLIAEMLTKEIGLRRGGQGTTAAGIQAILAELPRLGVATAGVQMRDGSGLDRGDRSTCQAALGALRLGQRPGFEALRDGLPVAGRTGTLYNRFLRTPVEGVLRAKTGTLRGVIGLVGTYPRQPGLSFALLANGGFDFAGARAVQDRVVQVISGYPFSLRDPEALAPPPPRPAA